jgi:hypothetical protein
LAFDEVGVVGVVDDAHRFDPRYTRQNDVAGETETQMYVRTGEPECPNGDTNRTGRRLRHR